MTEAHEATCDERRRLVGCLARDRPELGDDAAALQRELPVLVPRRDEDAAVG